MRVCYTRYKTGYEQSNADPDFNDMLLQENGPIVDEETAYYDKKINLELIEKSIKSYIHDLEKIIISSGKEGSNFFDELKKHFFVISFQDSDSLSVNNFSSQNILLIEKLSVNLLACFIEKSLGPRLLGPLRPVGASPQG